MNPRKKNRSMMKDVFSESISCVPSKDLKDSLFVSSKDPATNISHIQIFRTVSKWFKTCTPCQRKVVLCGITDRCSDNQLEYILTAVEPVFHRDFRNALTGNYPFSASITRSLSIRDGTKFIAFPFNYNKTLESFVYDYVKNIIANALKHVSKKPDEATRTKESILEQFSVDVQYGSELTNDEETSVEIQTKYRLPSITEDSQRNKYKRPGILRTGLVKHLPEIHHPKVTNQNDSAGSWKGAKQCGRQNKSTVKRGSCKHFQKQVKILWQWLHSWEDYQKIEILVELLKQCDQSLLQFYTQSLIQGLRDRNDINCLPDKLLRYIFSFLSASDINTAGKVSRRWHYIAAQDELWIMKCKEIGEKKAIADLIRLVEESKESCLIDWREAYYELSMIVDNLTTVNYYNPSDSKSLDVLTPAARITPPEEYYSDSSSSASSWMSSDIFLHHREHSQVVDLPLRQLETSKKESSVDLPEGATEKDDFNEWATPTPPKLQSKSKLEIKEEEEKKVVRKKKKVPTATLR